jgi:hypothetical protein
MPKRENVLGRAIHHHPNVEEVANAPLGVLWMDNFTYSVKKEKTNTI